MSLELSFTVNLWRKLSEYLEKYLVNGQRLRVREPNSVKFGGKIPDIVIESDKGIPVLVIETKRERRDGKEEVFLDPRSKGPVGQALCYAALALEKYQLDTTPLFATASRSVLAVFKGVKKEELQELVNMDKCRESSYEDSLKPAALSKLLNEFKIIEVENPLEDVSIKRLFDTIGKLLFIPPKSAYEVLISELREKVRELGENIEEALKSKLFEDVNLFSEYHRLALESGYGLGILNLITISPKCKEIDEKLCDYLKEAIAKTFESNGRKLLENLRRVLRRPLSEVCKEVKIQAPTCQEGVFVRDLISFDKLGSMLAYVLANKILAYKVLELHYDIPRLTPIHVGKKLKIDNVEIQIESVDKAIEALNKYFEVATEKIERKLGIKDFRPIFQTGLYDRVVVSGTSGLEKINFIITLLEDWKSELKTLPGIIGYVYEGLIPPRERHQLGEFYTPPAVARLIARWSIRTPSDRVLDPGCGSGTFLIEAYKRLLYLKYNKRYGDSYPECRENVNEHQDVLNNLYGVDINAFASSLTATHLMLMEPRCAVSKLNIEARDYFTLTRYSRAFSLQEVGEFDTIIGNPPYTRWVEIPEEVKENIRKRVDSEIKSYDLWANLRIGKEPGIYVYWIMHSAKNLLKDRGRLGMIVSNMWLQTDYGVDFGRYLLDNFRIVALIDLSYRLFEALISTVIVLAEKEPDKGKRDDNRVILIRVPPRISGKELSGEEARGVLDEVLRCIEESFTANGEVDTKRLNGCRDSYGIHYTIVTQKEIPRDRKWISLFFRDVESVVNKLEELADTKQIIIRAGEWFEPSYGNALYLCLTSWGKIRGVRNLGAKDFFYFSEQKAQEWNIPREYLAPAITMSRLVRTFTFTRDDWEHLKNEVKVKDRTKGKFNPVYLFMCSLPRDKLPENVKKYVEWGETECRTKIRGTRGGGRVCSEAKACRARAEAGNIFKGWYDLGGYIPTPIMAIRQPRYHPQFFAVDMPFCTYDAIITFIPKLKVCYKGFCVDPGDYAEGCEVAGVNYLKGAELNEKEVKALLAYLNSTFNWSWLEQNARYIAKGPLGLEVNVCKQMPILNVKNLRKEDVDELAKLFDTLEVNARKIIEKLGGSEHKEDEESSEEEETSSAKLEMFKELREEFKAIDTKIASLLGLRDIDLDWLWSAAWDMMERRIKGGKGAARAGVKEYVEIEDYKTKSRTKRRKSSHRGPSLDKWFKK